MYRELFFLQRDQRDKGDERSEQSLATPPPAHCLFHLTSLISLFKSAGVFKRDLRVLCATPLVHVEDIPESLTSS